MWPFRDNSEDRFWCERCRRVILRREGVKRDGYDGSHFHKLWVSVVKDGVDFGDWDFHGKLLEERRDAPSGRPTADGRLSLSNEPGRLTLVGR